MKTKKINLNERIEIAKWNIHYAQEDLVKTLVNFNIKSISVEWDLRQIQQWSRYLKNTCKMHDIEDWYSL